MLVFSHYQLALYLSALVIGTSATPFESVPICENFRYCSMISQYASNKSGWLNPFDVVQTLYSSLTSAVFGKEASRDYVYEGIESFYDLNDTSSDFDSWLDEQTERAFSGILANIGGVGIHSDEVSDGAVIASPSKSHPNYFYQWVRDAAITINSLVEYLQDHQDSLDSPLSKQLSYAIESYISNSYKLQRIDNRSGTWESLDGLGEPKFMANSEPFKENWGRPQRDGPGLRVITIANYIGFLVENNLTVTHPELPSIEYIYNEILKPDLTYIANNWNKNGFDLWEEIDSVHLFTSLTMLKALKSGIKISGDCDDSDFNSKLRLAFISLRFFILFESGFKISDIPYLIETPSLFLQGQRCGLDIGSVLATLRAHDLDDPTDFIDIPFSIDDTAVISTLSALVNDMRYRYPINTEKGKFSEGLALGRYPEDRYDGYGISEGNPWFISTATASEVLFKLVYYLYFHHQDLVITKDQYVFYASFTDFDITTEAKEVVLPFNSHAFVETTLSLMKYADSFLEVIKQHVDEHGNMSEQFNKYTGYMEGAENLTWSYGSFWSAMRWRKRASDAVVSYA